MGAQVGREDQPIRTGVLRVFQVQQDHDVNADIERRVMWNDNDECRATEPGGWDIGPNLKGSFVVYVCDRPRGHAGDHVDAHARIMWPQSVEILASV